MHVLLQIGLAFCTLFAAAFAEIGGGGWGTYNPGSLFSVRKRLPDSPCIGIGWSSSTKPFDIHSGFGDPSGPTFFRRHDGVSFAQEDITDKEAGIKANLNWVKTGDGSWVMRVKGEAISDKKDPITNFFVYVALVRDDPRDKTGPEEFSIEIESEEYALISASDSAIGPFKVEVREPNSGAVPYERSRRRSKAGDARRNPSIFHYVATQEHHPSRPESALYKYLAADLKNQEEEGSPSSILSAFLPDHVEDGNDLIVVQRLLKTPFEVDIVFDSDHDEDDIEDLIKAKEEEFDSRFARTFRLEQLGFDAEEIGLAKLALSNLLGGIGYFHGPLPVTRHGGEKSSQEVTDAVSMFSATPSRRSFPRPFLWDEGFHQMLISKWDPKLSMDALSSWLDTMEENGWIPREQTRGVDAMTRFPSHITQMMIQDDNVVNPPTLIMAVRALMNSNTIEIGGDGSAYHSAFIQRSFERLYKHIVFLAESQAGKGGSFLWQGRKKENDNDVIHTLASGLDDYPRARTISDEERHLDLACWIAWSFKNVAELAPADKPEVRANLEKTFASIKESLENLYSSSETNDPAALLCDYGSDGPACHLGYVTLFPLLLGLEEPSSPRLGALLDLMRDEDKLWSPGGLRSLSKTDKQFNKKDGYWTGPVWIPINFLALAALKNKYSVVEGPYRQGAEEIYKELRKNIVTNVLAEYKRTNTLWEQYNPTTGAGQRGEDFTGWTSLIVLIMGEMFDGAVV